MSRGGLRLGPLNILLVRFRFRLGTEANASAALSATPVSSAAGGNVAPGRQHMDAGWAGVGATSMDDLVGLHGAAALFEAEFTLSEMAAERVVHAPTAMLSGCRACACTVSLSLSQTRFSARV